MFARQMRLLLFKVRETQQVFNILNRYVLLMSRNGKTGKIE